MRSVQYGNRLIQYAVQEKPDLSSHYITVDRHEGVILKGKPVSNSKADQLILKKAKWILRKQALVKTYEKDVIVTGSRLPYFGKSYYVELIVDPSVDSVSVTFNYSKFNIRAKNANDQDDIKEALDSFYKEKAIEKIAPRVIRISQKSKLIPGNLSFRKMNKRWGSCSENNHVIFNIHAVKLPYSLIDYLIIHELSHTKVKDHSKAFWALLSKHEPKWRELDEKISEIKL